MVHKTIINNKYLDYWVAQVKTIFTLPQRIVNMCAPNLPQYLAYAEWFTDFADSPRPNHDLYIVKHALINGHRRASVISLDHIHRSIHLFSKFGSHAPREWTHDNVLGLCDTFYVNSLSDRHIYHTII